MELWRRRWAEDLPLNVVLYSCFSCIGPLAGGFYEAFCLMGGDDDL